MKKSFLTLSVILFCFLVQGQNKRKVEVNFNEIGYGLTSAEILAKQKLETSPSKSHLITGLDANLTKQTDSIPAIIGTQFAIIYSLESKKRRITVTIAWQYPKGMTDINGNELTETRYELRRRTNIEDYSSYTLEGENEVVTGTWTFQIFYKDDLLHERDFYLF